MNRQTHPARKQQTEFIVGIGEFFIEHSVGEPFVSCSIMGLIYPIGKYSNIIFE